MLEHSVLPATEGRHIARGRAAGGKFDGWIDPFHELGGLSRNPPIFPRGLSLHLPWAVHLVAQAPKPHVMGLLPSMSAAQIGQLRATREVAIFEEASSIIGSPGAEVDSHHGLHTGRTAPVHKLI